MRQRPEKNAPPSDADTVMKLAVGVFLVAMIALAAWCESIGIHYPPL